MINNQSHNLQIGGPVLLAILSAFVIIQIPFSGFTQTLVTTLKDENRTHHDANSSLETSAGQLLKSADPYNADGYQKKVVVQILDENHIPTEAKIRITEQDTIYIAPEAHRPDFTIGEGGSDAMLAGDRRFAFSAKLPKDHIATRGLR